MRVSEHAKNTTNSAVSDSMLVYDNITSFEGFSILADASNDFTIQIKSFNFS